jgi:hypothetical protein
MSYLDLPRDPHRGLNLSWFRVREEYGDRNPESRWKKEEGVETV